MGLELLREASAIRENQVNWPPQTDREQTEWPPTIRFGLDGGQLVRSQLGRGQLL